MNDAPCMNAVEDPFGLVRVSFVVPGEAGRFSEQSNGRF